MGRVYVYLFSNIGRAKTNHLHWRVSDTILLTGITMLGKSSLLHFSPNFPIALTVLVNLELLIELLYIYWPSSPSFLHLTHVSNHYWENSARPEKKNCHKTKSNEVIDKTSGGPHAMTCSCNLALIRYFCSLLGGPGGNWSKQICLQIISLISDEHYRNTQAVDHSDHTDPASQPAWRQWEVRFRKLAASTSTRPGEIREISCVITESREEANKNTHILQSDDYSSPVSSLQFPLQQDQHPQTDNWCWW